MIYDITNHQFIKCNKCGSIMAYEEQDTWISTDRKYDIFALDNFTYVKKL